MIYVNKSRIEDAKKFLAWADEHEFRVCKCKDIGAGTFSLETKYGGNCTLCGCNGYTSEPRHRRFTIEQVVSQIGQTRFFF